MISVNTTMVEIIDMDSEQLLEEFLILNEDFQRNTGNFNFNGVKKR